MLKAACSFCKREYVIEPSDPQYSKIKNNLTKMYVCKKCNNVFQEEARKNVDLDPAMLDPHNYDKLV
jgi:uncharacterized protein YlaI